MPVTDDDAAVGSTHSELVLIQMLPFLVHEVHMYICKQAAAIGQVIVRQMDLGASNTKTLQRNLGSASASLLSVIILSSW